MPKPDSYFCHFLGKPPSVLQVLDDPTVELDELIEATALQLEPREIDQGRASYWQVTAEKDERHINAGFAARRNSRQALGVFRLDPGIAQAASVVIEHDRDDSTFECIADLHRSLHLGQQDVRTMLVHHLLNTLQRGDLDRDFVYYKLSKGKVSELVIGVYGECQNVAVELELHKAWEWARRLVTDRE
jgi:hypothetical protein